MRKRGGSARVSIGTFISYFRHRITNAKSEGFNSVIDSLK
jgi:hypothetical protein